MKIPAVIFTIAFLIVAEKGFTQSFQNLNFESANVPSVPFGQGGVDVNSSQGIPGWTAYLGGSPVGSIMHNNVPIGSAAISIFGPQWFPSQILESNYSVLVAGSSPGAATDAAIGQTGQIPLASQTLTFYVSPSSSLTATFAGQAIPLVQIGSGANYKILGGNISAFAGQTGELRFNAAVNAGGILDNIQFSSQPIPEPSSLVLLLTGISTLLLGFFRRRNSSR